MKFFVGIVPPPDIYGQLQQIQTRFGDNRLEPHITIRPPVSPLHLDQWVHTITSLCATFEPFNINLLGTGFFGNRVLFVNVQSSSLNNLHNLLIPALQPFEPKEAAESDGRFHPHLTLGRTWCGFTTDNFRDMKQLADEFLLAHTASFKVTHLRIYHKPEHHGRFKTYRDITLNNVE